MNHQKIDSPTDKNLIIPEKITKKDVRQKARKKWDIPS